MKNQIVENNRMIAEFMGAKIEFNGFNLGCYWSDEFCPTYSGISLHDLKFHSLWNSLMPVVQKIESLKLDGFTYTFTMTTCNIFFEHPLILDNSYIVQVERTENMMIDIYTAVIEFIKWYNKNN